MAVSPWKPFPVHFPNGTPTVWVRFRSFERRPFKATWTDDEYLPSSRGGVVFNDDYGNERRVPWQLLDAWHLDT